MNEGTSVAGAMLIVRPAVAADVVRIASIYREQVLNGAATFEIDPPDESEIERRWRDVVAQGCPWLVAAVDGRVIGYAYANLYRTRAAYRYTAEDSIYIDAAHRRSGAGGRLLAALIAETTAGGFRQMVAVIGDSANAASIRLHERCGFSRVGLLSAVGYKFGRWIDSVLMQRSLGEGPASAPPELRRRGV